MAKSVECIKPYKGLISNFSYLSVLEVLKVVFPLLTVPYLFRVLGVDIYGLVVFAQSIIAYLSILISFGLEIKATKDIAVYREDKKKLSEIVLTITYLKFLLFLSVALIFVIIVFTSSFFASHKLLYILSLSIVFNDIMLPYWYFQGIEQMKYITLIRFTVVSVFTALTFIVIRSPEDYIYVNLLQGLGGVVGGGMIYYLIFIKHSLSFYIPPLDTAKLYFKESLPFFFSRLASLINQTLAKVASGFFLGMEQVAVYDLAYKICGAACIPLQTINTALFPYNAKKQNTSFVKKMLYVSIALGVVLMSITVLFADFFVKILSGKEIIEAVYVTYILSGYVLMCSMSLYLGSPVLVAFGYFKPFNTSVIYSTLLLIAAYLILYLGNIFNLYMFSACLVIIESYIVIYRLWYCIKYRIIVFK